MKLRPLVLASAIVVFAPLAYAQTPTSPPVNPDMGAKVPPTASPSDGRTGGTGPMSGTPQTDKTLSHNPSIDLRARRAAMRGQTPVANDDVRKVQVALAGKGHDAGTVDGVMGSKTRAALRSYQRAQGIPPTGRVDPKTRSALGI